MEPTQKNYSTPDFKEKRGLRSPSEETEISKFCLNLPKGFAEDAKSSILSIESRPSFPQSNSDFNEAFSNYKTSIKKSQKPLKQDKTGSFQCKNCLIL